MTYLYEWHEQYLLSLEGLLFMFLLCFSFTYTICGRKLRLASSVLLNKVLGVSGSGFPVFSNITSPRIMSIFAFRVVLFCSSLRTLFSADSMFFDSFRFSTLYCCLFFYIEDTIYLIAFSF
ncbi:hypothetical protein P170DRAFT_184777 [Aspergillus steynii IBT 23096]|uniref:Uncharacterized protein n=1 Tax=Aspergillus steynii IBT 23096 TaxID=1392250 RepID=A0A2I2G9B2_9EURO|nr:uncharacterized protein P170DRAFT_184777 [Aspergillus steynii IBT 23096]PLB49472.1 hypothetical protein P170DRAFT_184777 [Aspergillus steynii IBT 23096]